MHTSSLLATATPNTDWNRSGIGHFWLSWHNTKLEVEGVAVPNAVDLRVFLAFGTVQTEET